MNDELFNYNIDTPYGSINLTTKHHHCSFSSLEEWYRLHQDVIAAAFKLDAIAFRLVNIRTEHSEVISNRVMVCYN